MQNKPAGLIIVIVVAAVLVFGSLIAENKIRPVVPSCEPPRTHTALDRDECYDGYAKGSEIAAYCDFIQNSTIRDSCLAFIAEHSS